MKICLLSNALSTHTKRWVKCLTEKGNKVYLISFRRDKISGIPTLCYEPKYNNLFYKSLYLLRHYEEVKKRIWEIKPDILHAHYLTSYGFLGVLSKYRPLVVSAWGSDIFVDSRKSFLHRLIIKKVLEEAELITVMADHMINHVKKLSGDANKIMKVTLGVDLEKFNVAQRSLSNKDKIVILSTRVFEKEQNIEYFIASLPYVIRKKNNVEIQFYGDGSLRKHCQKILMKLGIQSYTKFFSLVDHEQMPNCYRRADIYVSTSTSDGDHVSLMEAMACGTFPVVSDILANREWIKDGVNGFRPPLNDPKSFGDKIIKAIEDKALRENALSQNFELIKAKASYGSDGERLIRSYYDLVKKKNRIANNENSIH